jgi:hypothetical protein
MAEVLFEGLEIYLDYDRLKAKDLAKILSNLSFISSAISEDYFSRFEDYAGGISPSLDIETINTGGSIKFNLVEGWKVDISSSEEADIIIDIPRKLGIPALIGYLLITSASNYQDFKNKTLDNRVKELEIKLKEIELAKALAITSKSEDKNTFRLTYNYVDNKVPEIKPVIMDTIKTVLRNPDITKFKINGIELKDIDKQ